jgi:hypothetical protein
VYKDVALLSLIYGMCAAIAAWHADCSRGTLLGPVVLVGKGFSVRWTHRAGGAEKDAVPGHEHHTTQIRTRKSACLPGFLARNFCRHASYAAISFRHSANPRRPASLSCGWWDGKRRSRRRSVDCPLAPRAPINPIDSTHPITYIDTHPALGLLPLGSEAGEELVGLRPALLGPPREVVAHAGLDGRRGHP